jgi:FAD:protein FMN transferase
MSCPCGELKMTKNLIIIFLIVLLTSCRGSRQTSFKLEWIAMGTFVDCTVEAENQKEAHEYFDLVKQEFAKISESFNVYNSNSVISIINRDSQFRPVKINDYEYCLITNSVAGSLKTEMAFNPVCLPLIQLWGFSGGTNTTVPSKEMISDAMKKVDVTNVHCVSNTISFSHYGMQLDMGGVAKGYAVDMAYDALDEKNVEEFIINLGGNIRVKTKKDFLRIGIRDPYNKSNIMGVLKLKSGYGVATSGDYERFVIIDGIKYSHIIDPRSGYPVKNSIAATVVAPSATQTDMLSTAMFVLGKTRINDVVDMFPNIAILVISKHNGEISISMSDEDIFDLF